jgi:hypothetical protein
MDIKCIKRSRVLIWIDESIIELMNTLLKHELRELNWINEYKIKASTMDIGWDALTKNESYDYCNGLINP